MIRLLALLLVTSSFGAVNAPPWFGATGNTFGWRAGTVSGGGGGGGNGLLTGLAEYWDMDEAGTVDRVGKVAAIHLVSNSGATSGTGKINNGVVLVNASNQYLSVADNATMSSGATSFSLSIWAKLNSTGGGDPFMTIISKDDASSGREYSILYQASDGKLLGVSGNGPTIVTGNTFGAVTTGVWYHLVLVYDRVGDTLKLYINGTSDSVADTADPPDGSAAFYVGRLGNDQYEFDGVLDELGFWKRALSSGDVTTLNNSGSALPYSSFD